MVTQVDASLSTGPEEFEDSLQSHSEAKFVHAAVKRVQVRVWTVAVRRIPT